MKIFTWHIHGTYLYYLSQGDYEIYIPVTPNATGEGYYGRGKTFPFGKNVIEVPVSDVKNMDFDCILFQTNRNYLEDQYQVLSEEQRLLPRIYLEHDPPTQHPVNAKHIMQDPTVTFVHVTHFNQLMWDNGAINTTVIEHGVTTPSASYGGELEKGIVVINNLPSRGRLLGLDIFLAIKKHIPLDLVGMGTGEFGQGEVLHPELAQHISRYRFFFNPIRWTSLGLAVCEAMAIGLPIVGLATTELAAVLQNGVSGYIHTNPGYLIDKMKLLLNDRNLACQIGKEGKKIAEERFNINRFTQEWKELFERVITQRKHKPIFTGPDMLIFKE